MSKTIVDMPKVAQMLDNGWQVSLFKNGLGSYSADARHKNPDHKAKVAAKLLEQLEPEVRELMDANDIILTDDFTPEQALTRLAYKVHGEILR